MTHKKSPSASLIRSSAAEYLTFVAASGTGGIESICADENVWLSTTMIAQLYDVEVSIITGHLRKIFDDSELEEVSVVRTFRTTAPNGESIETEHYNLSAVISVGYKVNSERAVQFEALVVHRETLDGDHVRSKPPADAHHSLLSSSPVG